MVIFQLEKSLPLGNWVHFRHKNNLGIQARTIKKAGLKCPAPGTLDHPLKALPQLEYQLNF